MKKIYWKPLLLAAAVMSVSYFVAGVIAPSRLWWAFSLVVWFGCISYYLAGKGMDLPHLHALLAASPISLLALAASLNDGALIPLVAAMLLGAAGGVEIRRRRSV